MLDPNKYPSRADYLRASANRWNERAAYESQQHLKYADLHRAGASPVHKTVAEYHSRQAKVFAKYAREDLQAAIAIEATPARNGLIRRVLRALGVWS